MTPTRTEKYQNSSGKETDRPTTPPGGALHTSGSMGQEAIADWNTRETKKCHKSEANTTIILGGKAFGLSQGLWWLGSNTSNNNVTHNELNLAKFSRTKHTCRGYPKTEIDNYGIAATQANHNYIRTSTPYRNKQPITNTPQVILPDGSLMQDTHREVLNLNPLLTPTERKSHI